MTKRVRILAASVVAALVLVAAVAAWRGGTSENRPVSRRRASNRSSTTGTSTSPTTRTEPGPRTSTPAALPPLAAPSRQASSADRSYLEGVGRPLIALHDLITGTFKPDGPHCQADLLAKANALGAPIDLMTLTSGLQDETNLEGAIAEVTAFAPLVDACASGTEPTSAAAQRLRLAHDLAQSRYATIGAVHG